MCELDPLTVQSINEIRFLIQKRIRAVSKVHSFNTKARVDYWTNVLREFDEHCGLLGALTPDAH